MRTGTTVDTERITAEHLTGDRFSIDIRGHRVTVDQPLSNGGDDSAPTPTELFVASLTSCVAFYAHRYLVRHGIPSNGLSVSADFSMASRPARVGEVDITLKVPEGLPTERRDGLLAVASHCTVHNTLKLPPAVRIALTDA
jgi:putative redox protein